MTTTSDTGIAANAIAPADFIRRAVAKAAPRVAYTEADLRWATTRLALHLEPMHPNLTAKIAFNPKTIDSFITTALPDMAPASRGNLRSILLRMSEVLLGERAPRVPLTPMAASDPSVPYSLDETQAIRAWASGAQADRRIEAGALIALGLAAGLSGGEIANVRVADILTSGTNVLVTVTGPRRRTVRVDGAWTRLLAKATTGRAEDAFVFCPKREGASKNLVNNFIARTRGTLPGPNSQRMRATWIVEQLNGGSTPNALLEQTGVRNLSALQRFMSFANAA